MAVAAVAATVVLPTLASSMMRAKVNSSLLVGLLLLTGCVASGPPPPRGTGVTTSQVDPLEVPADFSLDLIVWADDGRDLRQPDDAPPVRAGRFILFCDGSLHWSGRVEDPEDEMPPLRRILRRADMAALWTLIRQLGMDDATRATPAVNVRLVEPPPGEVLYLAVLTGDGQRWAFQRQAPSRDQPDPAMTSLVGRLSELAWADLVDVVPVIPRRYQFGPDPYARYRR